MTRSVRDFSKTSTSTEVPHTDSTVGPVTSALIYTGAVVLILVALFAILGSMRDPKNRRSYQPTPEEQKELNEWPAL
jgi:hypothetical protein